MGDGWMIFSRLIGWLMRREGLKNVLFPVVDENRAA
jgi:hypothetical protein